MTAPSGDATLLDLKQAARKLARQRRLALEPACRRRAAQAAARALRRSACYRQASVIGAYLAYGSEFDPAELLDMAVADGKRIAVPVIGHNGIMQLRLWRPRVALRRNRHGIREPLRTPRIPLSRVHLLLMPLLAYDRCGRRLGAGGGYYDRLLAQHPRRPLRIGLAYAVQAATDIPAAPHDQALHAVLTEHGLHHFPIPSDC